MKGSRVTPNTWGRAGGRAGARAGERAGGRAGKGPRSRPWQVELIGGWRLLLAHHAPRRLARQPGRAERAEPRAPLCQAPTRGACRGSRYSKKASPHRRDGVDSKHHVAELHHRQHQQQRRGHACACRGEGAAAGQQVALRRSPPHGATLGAQGKNARCTRCTVARRHDLCKRHPLPVALLAA